MGNNAYLAIKYIFQHKKQHYSIKITYKNNVSD